MSKGKEKEALDSPMAMIGTGNTSVSARQQTKRNETKQAVQTTALPGWYFFFVCCGDSGPTMGGVTVEFLID